MASDKQGARAWLRDRTKDARRQAAPAIGLGLAATGLAVVQAGCAALVLRGGLRGIGAVPVWAVAVFVLAALLRMAANVAADTVAVRAGAAARLQLRTEMVTRLLAAGPAMLRSHHSSALATTVVDRIDALDGFFARWLPVATLAWAAPLLVLLAVAVADWRAALVLGGAGLLVPVAQAVSGIGAAAASRRQFTALSRLQARFLDRVRGIATIVLAGRSDDEASALAASARELRVRTMRVLRVAFIASAALDCALALAMVVIALRYGAEAMRPGFDAGRALFVLLLVPEFFAPLRAFSAAYQDRVHAQGAAEELAEVPPMPPAPDAGGAVRTVEARGVSVAFEAVRFTWDPARGPALDGLSFRVPAGETLVLAGPSGAGKSTVIEILLGFIRPESGRVLINGADIASIVPEALSRMTAWIGQRPMLFAGTLRENIAFGRPEATAQEVEAAARHARVMSFAEALPDGLDTVVGEGGFGLSGGQAQRVSIARAFLKNAPLLLLDEPTAHLDPATEGEVIESLRRLAVGRTVVMASHASVAQAFGSRRVDLRDGRAAPARGAA
jgi:ATP-binding cassette subfamily C protein CydD